MYNKSNDPKIEKQLLDLFENTPGSMTISGAKIILAKEHDILVSPQVVKTHLENLEAKGKLRRLNPNG